MKKIILSLLAAVVLLGTVSAQAGLSADALKARTMVKDGIAFFQANGKDAAFAVYNDPKGKFRDGEFYLFVYDFSKDDTAINVARGDGNLAQLGRDLWNTKDPDGKFFYRDIIAAGKAGSGWVDYKRTNPETKKIENKSSYIERIPGTNFLVGCGFYK